MKTQVRRTVVAGDIRPQKNAPLRSKWYQAVRILEEVQTLGERATILRYTHIAYIVSLILR